MDVDLAALKAIERDRDIPMDYLLKTLEDALLNAYHKTPHALRGVGFKLRTEASLKPAYGVE